MIVEYQIFLQLSEAKKAVNVYKLNNQSSVVFR